ncbi:DNA polymerase III subunit delta [Spiractinospora alimapuensis]|uniref:DNA polymerase III subunit delta n=1 Tax=Spiractinospora alimapuensis TaxID=2820884 RepID=UPI001F2593C6|nr:DNA polymerase III subunit delta [Spiractinospora alimapuensis]
MPATALAPLYLVVGDEELLIDRAVAELVALARGEDPQVDVHDLLPAQVTAGSLSEVLSPSLFGERRVVVLRSAQDLTKDPAAAVTGILTTPVDDVTLVLVHAGGNKGKALLQAAASAGAKRVNCPKPTKNQEKLAFVKGEFDRAGRAVTRDGAQAILDARGTDLREIAAACAQLSADAEGTINAETVARYYTGRAEASGFTVADHAVEGKLGDALETLRWSLAIGTAPVLINSALASAIRGLAVVSQPQRGLGDAELAKRARVPPWKLRTLRQQARGWTPAGITRALELVAETDAQVKGAGADPSYALERAVSGIVTARRDPAAV